MGLEAYVFVTSPLSDHLRISIEGVLTDISDEVSRSSRGKIKSFFIGKRTYDFEIRSSSDELFDHEALFERGYLAEEYPTAIELSSAQKSKLDFSNLRRVIDRIVEDFDGVRTYIST